MANSTTNLDTISSTQANKEATANAFFDAASPASLFGRRATTTTALSWGYFGGRMLVDGVLTNINNGTVALTGSTTNYVEATAAGVVSKNTTGFTPGSIPLYTIVTGASSVTSYTDERTWVTPEYLSQKANVAITSADVTLSAAQARCKTIVLTGILTGNRSLIVPNNGEWNIVNTTTGAYEVTVKTAAGTGVVVVQGASANVLADGTNVISIGGSVSDGVGGGDVSGPLTSTDNAIARFDGTGGGTLQNSGVTISDTDAMSGPSSVVIEPDQASTYAFKLTGRQVAGVAVPYFVPSTADTPVAFDIFPKGSPSDFTANTGVAWEDICSTDIEADGTNYEALRLGIFSGGDAHISHAKGGTGTVRNLRMQINGGNFGIGVTSSPAYLLTINGTTTPALGVQDGGVDKFFFGQATASGNWFTNSSDGDHCIRGMGGAMLFGTNASTPAYQFGITNTGAIYNPTHGTTASAANMFINSSTGQISRSTSSRKYKRNIKTLPDAGSIIDGLRPVTYTSKCKGDDPSQVMIGLIAEEVAEVCPELATFDKDGKPNGVQYERLAVLLLKEIQRMRAA
jgi:hypothetical protein